MMEMKTVLAVILACLISWQCDTLLAGKAASKGKGAPAAQGRSNAEKQIEKTAPAKAKGNQGAKPVAAEAAAVEAKAAVVQKGKGKPPAEESAAAAEKARGKEHAQQSKAIQKQLQSEEQKHL